MSTDYIQSIEQNARFVEAFKSQMTAGLIGLGDQAGVMTDAIFAGQHVMFEGEPGVGKTELVKNIGFIVVHEGTPFAITSRLQGASDRQPADFLGSEVYNQKIGDFEKKKGPIFAHFVLADEVNRNSTKTQAALHEAMAEGSVTIGGESLLLPKPFTVFATLNSHEFGQATSQMSDALLDRFGASAYFPAPKLHERSAVGKAFAGTGHLLQPEKILAITDIPQIQRVVERIGVEEKAIDTTARLLDLIFQQSGVEVVSRGHRSMQVIIRLAQANALRNGKAEATIEQIRTVLPVALSHRIKSVDDDTSIDTKRRLIDDVIKRA